MKRKKESITTNAGLDKISIAIREASGNPNCDYHRFPPLTSLRKSTAMTSFTLRPCQNRIQDKVVLHIPDIYHEKSEHPSDH